MYVDAIMTSPVDFDFGEGYAETWDIVYPSVEDWSLQDCHSYLREKGGDLPEPNPFDMNREEMTELLNEVSIEVDDKDSDETLLNAIIENINDGTIYGLEDWHQVVEEVMQDNPDDFSPMMNYYYPLPNFSMDPAKAQAILHRDGGAVCVVLVGDEPALALTGGGMDMSWDICEAFILLNYYPPFRFTDLPKFAGEKLTPKNKRVIDACIETAEILQNWSTQRVAALTEYKASLVETKEN
jgi:hypothetical protein